MEDRFGSSASDRVNEGVHTHTTTADGHQQQRIDPHLAMSRSAFFGRMKKIMRYLFSGEPELWQASEAILRTQPGECT